MISFAQFIAEAQISHERWYEHPDDERIITHEFHVGSDKVKAFYSTSVIQRHKHRMDFEVNRSYNSALAGASHPIHILRHLQRSASQFIDNYHPKVFTIPVSGTVNQQRRNKLAQELAKKHGGKYYAGEHPEIHFK